MRLLSQNLQSCVESSDILKTDSPFFVYYMLYKIKKISLRIRPPCVVIYVPPKYEYFRSLSQARDNVLKVMNRSCERNDLSDNVRL